MHTMYVDKRLDGVKAVQTMSRLNRTCPGKEDTFILDFVNKREDILAAFQPYYEQTQLSDVTDPNKLYDLKTKIDSFKIIYQADIDAFCAVFFKNKELQTKREHAQLNSIVDVAVARFEAIEKDEHKEDFANTLGVFVRLYAFLAQIMPFQDVELEKFYAYSRLLLKKLPGPMVAKGSILAMKWRWSITAFRKLLMARFNCKRIQARLSSQFQRLEQRKTKTNTPCCPK